MRSVVKWIFKKSKSSYKNTNKLHKLDSLGRVCYLKKGVSGPN